MTDGRTFTVIQMNKFDVSYAFNPDRIIRWANVGILLAVLLVRRLQTNLAHRPTLLPTVGSCWSNTLSPTNPAYANVMPTILFQVSRWANVGRTWLNATTYYESVSETWFSSWLHVRTFVLISGLYQFVVSSLDICWFSSSCLFVFLRRKQGNCRLKCRLSSFRPEITKRR